MNLDDLRAVQIEERQTDSLQPLRDSFYADVAEYVTGLRRERDRAAERAEDPFGSEEVRRLTDEIETAVEVAEAVYERRVGKVVKRASLAAAGMPADDEGLTAEESELFSDLVSRIEENREAVLDAVGDTGESAGEKPNAAPDPPEPSPDPGDGLDASAAMGAKEPDDPPVEGEEREADAGGTSAPGGDGAGGGEEGRVTVRITRDVGEIFGVDEHTYTLATEDVVTLPEENAEPLIEREAAERL